MDSWGYFNRKNNYRELSIKVDSVQAECGPSREHSSLDEKGVIPASGRCSTRTTEGCEPIPSREHGSLDVDGFAFLREALGYKILIQISDVQVVWDAAGSVSRLQAESLQQTKEAPYASELVYGAYIRLLLRVQRAVGILRRGSKSNSPSHWLQLKIREMLT